MLRNVNRAPELDAFAASATCYEHGQIKEGHMEEGVRRKLHRGMWSKKNGS